MFSNYIRTIIRGLRKNSTYAALNVIGLAVGFACVLYISLYINHEATYDQFIPKYERIFRLSESSYALTSPTRIEYLKENMDGMENYTLLLNSGTFTVGNGTSKIIDRSSYYATDDFFKIFSYKLVSGSYSQFSEVSNSVVITRSFSEQIFGNEPALDKDITIYSDGQDIPYKIVAVIEDLPTNTHMPFNLIAHMPAEVLARERDNWGYTIYHGYFRMKEAESTIQIQQTIERIFAQRAIDNNSYKNIKTVDQLLASNRFKTSEVLRVDDIHLQSNKNFDLQAGGNYEYLWVFGGTALFVLILAAINFINLSTAQSAKKAKEVGVRKVLGSSRRMLIAQFLTESVLLCLIASLLAVGMVEFFISFMKSYAAINYSFSLLTNQIFLVVLVIVAFLTGLLSGIYPALFLTSFVPVRVLKGQFANRENTAFYRNTLVVFQFTISLCLGIFMFFIYSQLHFGLTKDAGFERENLVTVDNSLDQLGGNSKAFKDHLLQDTRFTNAGFFNFKLFSMNTTFVSPVNNANAVDPFRVYYQWTDANYLPTLGVKFIAGRNFDENRVSDTSVMVINETAAKQLGFEDPIGQILNFGGSPGKFKIIGVIKDFHHQAFTKQVPPTLFVYFKNIEQAMTIRLAKGDVATSIDVLKKNWSKFSDQPLNYHFVDQQFQKLFDKEEQLSKIIVIFTVLALLVACLGLLGLVGYTAEQKTKEIGIRKVLGASVTQIVKMFSNRFIRLVLIAMLFAAPLAFYITNSWLSTFAYHIQISFWPFVIVGVVGLAIVLLTVSYHMIKAAIANPINSLKDE